MFVRFRDRRQAGRILARRLAAYADRPDVVVAALPPGGVPVGYEVARALNVPLDVLPVCKLDVPGAEAYGMGAVVAGGLRVLSRPVVEEFGVSAEAVERATAAARREVERRARAYRHGRPPVRLAGRTVVLVGDGLATGGTMQAAVEVARRQGAARVVVAAPVAPPDTCRFFERAADRFVCVVTPPPKVFDAVASWYDHFPQVADDQVRRLLAEVLPAPVDHGVGHEDGVDDAADVAADVKVPNPPCFPSARRGGGRLVGV